MTNSALEAIVRENKREPLPDSATRNEIRDARDDFVQKRTNYGPLHVTVDAPLLTGGVVQIEIASPLALLHYAAAHSRGFSQLVRSTVEHDRPTGASPWEVVVYADEVTPGNVIGVAHRKAWVVYFSVANFPYFALSDELAWFTPLVLRSEVIKTIAGGISFFTGHFLKNDVSTCQGPHWWNHVAPDD